MTAFAYELASLLKAQGQARPGDPDGPYAMPWYLVLGTPGSGRSTAIRAMNLSWPHGDAAVQMTVPAPACTYWMPEKAVFIEPGSTVVGPSRQHGLLQDLCEELKIKRPREPIDGLVLVVSAQLLADDTEDGVEEYAKELRRDAIEVSQALGTEIPVYVVVTAYDTLWGFGDVFRWTAERSDEEPWGLSLKPGLPGADTPQAVVTELEGLSARIESMCFAKLSTEDAPEERVRAFQHLSEARELMTKVASFMNVITLANAFERAPWMRALAIGSGIPGTGNRLRHGVQQFMSMGLHPPAESGTPTPGGMPLHALLTNVLLPEKDLVPTRVRWRDDKLLVLLAMLGAVLWLGLIIVMIAQAVR